MSKKTRGPRAPLPLPTIAATLAPFWSKLSEGQLIAVQRYVSLLLDWNEAVNLTAIDDPIEVLSRHFGESLFAASLLRIGASRLADVGTGPGFPGLPLRIICPDMKLTLFEPNIKKCAFLKEVTQRLEMNDVGIFRQRYEEYQRDVGGFDFVCSRALGDYHSLLPWSRGVLNPGGSLVLWLGTEESIRLGRRKEFTWDAPIPIPESRRRVILIGRNAIVPRETI